VLGPGIAVQEHPGLPSSEPFALHSDPVGAVAAVNNLISGADERLPMAPQQSDRMILRERFEEIEAKICNQFTYDACCTDDGANALCPAYSCPSRNFLQQDVSGETVWLNAPFTNQYLTQCISHYMECKKQKPASTSACILVPKWSTGDWVPLLKNMQLLVEYPAGSVLFSQPASHPGGERRTMQGTPWAVQVWYDAPVQECSSMHEPGDLIMSFNAEISGMHGIVLMDTGASDCFFSEQFVHGLDVVRKPCPVTSVKMANGSLVNISERCEAHIRIRNHVSTVSGFILPCIVPGKDVILGQTWLLQQGAVLHYTAGPKVSLQSNGSRVVIKANTVHAVQAPLEALAFVTNKLFAASSVELLSAKQAKKLIKRGARAFAMLVQVDHRGDTQVSANSEGNVHSCATASGGEESEGLCSEAAIAGLQMKYGRIFEELPNKLPPDRGIGHTIPTEAGIVPPFRRQYRLAPSEQDEVRRQLADLIAKGYIEPSSSPYGAPVLFVDKPDGSLRMVIDYRALNAITIKNKFPIPHPQDLFDKLSGASVFSSLDLAQGYYQVLISEEDRPKTAFVTPQGLFQFKVLAMGLCNSANTFQALMSRIFAPYIGKFVLVYLDDILIYSKSAAEHEKHLELVFALLQKHEFYCRAHKCVFNKSEVKYLGHIVGRYGLRMDPRKISVVKDWARPTDVKQLRSFLGLANYFRRFVQGYSSLVACLTKLTHTSTEKIPFTELWKEEQQKAFEGVKTALTTAPVLALPDFTQSFELISDASLNGTGAVLVQSGRPVAYTSSKFSSAEYNYTTGEQELLGVFNALTEWRCYIEGGEKALLVTDHNPLVYLQSQATLSRKQARWMEFLSRFNYDWLYRPGRINVADPISRNPALCSIVAFTAELFAAHNMRAAAVPPPPSVLPLLERILAAYAQDQWFTESKNTDKLIKHSKGVWMRGQQVVVPNSKEIKMSILHEMHDSVSAGHPGAARMLELVTRKFWWPAIALDVVDYVRTCPSCQRNKSTNQKPGGKLMPLDIPDRRWGSVSTDLIVFLPMTANDFDAIAVFVDRLSKMVHFVPCRSDISAEEFADLFVDNVVKLHGIPNDIISDRGTQYTSAFWRQVCVRMGIAQRMSTAYHPQTDGQTERMNRVLEEMLRSFVGPNLNDWDKLLPMAEFAVNNSVNSTVQNTPFFLNSGQHPRSLFDGTPSDLVPASVQFTETLRRAVTTAKECMAQAQDRQRQYYDKGRRVVAFTVGQQVLLNSVNLRPPKGTAKKLLPRWIGPFTVTELIGQNAVRIKLPQGWRHHPVFNVQLLKPFRERENGGTVQPPQPCDWVDNEPLYTVDSLLDYRVKKVGKVYVTEFLVKWLGFDSTQNSWEPEKNLLTCAELISAFWESKGGRPPKPQNPKKKSQQPKAPVHVALDNSSLRRSSRLAPRASHPEGGEL
jgi:hypothetical protein